MQSEIIFTRIVVNEDRLEKKFRQCTEAYSDHLPAFFGGHKRLRCLMSLIRKRTNFCFGYSL